MLYHPSQRTAPAGAEGGNVPYVLTDFGRLPGGGQPGRLCGFRHRQMEGGAPALADPGGHPAGPCPGGGRAGRPGGDAAVPSQDPQGAFFRGAAYDAGAASLHPGGPSLPAKTIKRKKRVWIFVVHTLFFVQPGSGGSYSAVSSLSGRAASSAASWASSAASRAATSSAVGSASPASISGLAVSAWSSWSVRATTVTRSVSPRRMTRTPLP